ncbi:PREDICTED: uncharacterized protein LOC104810193 [Tarenaya hassleriana]|uniref:uncharacterized protein LOC104810193 n=1 Tax=Tarenaya hassleriana TaxID=28532 RepID=UPI00053C0E8D|nr:PREDICTED: uncharacterized protein LOC104810193 [Tarenaya hassleriana]
MALNVRSKGQQWSSDRDGGRLFIGGQLNLGQNTNEIPPPIAVANLTEALCAIADISTQMAEFMWKWTVFGQQLIRALANQTKVEANGVMNERSANPEVTVVIEPNSRGAVKAEETITDQTPTEGESKRSGTGHQVRLNDLIGSEKNQRGQFGLGKSSTRPNPMTDFGSENAELCAFEGDNLDCSMQVKRKKTCQVFDKMTKKKKKKKEAIDGLIKCKGFRLEAEESNWRGCATRTTAVLRGKLGRKSMADKVVAERSFSLRFYRFGRMVWIQKEEVNNAEVFLVVGFYQQSSRSKFGVRQADEVKGTDVDRYAYGQPASQEGLLGVISTFGNDAAVLSRSVTATKSSLICKYLMKLTQGNGFVGPPHCPPSWHYVGRIGSLSHNTSMGASQKVDQPNHTASSISSQVEILNKEDEDMDVSSIREEMIESLILGMRGTVSMFVALEEPRHVAMDLCSRSLSSEGDHGAAPEPRPSITLSMSAVIGVRPQVRRCCAKVEQRYRHSR